MTNFADAVRKYWIFVLGFCVVFASILYLFTIIYSEKLLPPVAIVVIGLVAGLSLLVGGFSLYKRQKLPLAEILAGFGCSVIFATVAYSGLAGIWTTISAFIVMVSFTAAIAWVSFRFDLRILTSLAFAGALFAPFIVRADSLSMVILFSYVFVINLAILFFAVMRRWHELPVIGLVLTGFLYLSYYLGFQPQGFAEPFVYVSALYLLYAVGLLLSSRKDGEKFEGLTLWLSLVNGIWFAFWSIYIFNAFALNTTIPVLVVGLVFLVSALVIYRSFPQSMVAILIYFFGGIVLLAVSGGDVGNFYGAHNLEHVARAAIWLGIVLVLCGAAWFRKLKGLFDLGITAWVAVFLYWFVFAWDIGNVRWFGVDFVPFINPPALLWMALAASGFVISRFYERLLDGLPKSVPEVTATAAVKVNLPPPPSRFPALLLSLLSHLAVGGLLTIQVLSIWDFWHNPAISAALVLSMVWGIYALLLFLWGIYAKSRFFIYFADGVLVIVAIKVVLFDASGSGSIFKALSIFSTGLIICGIGYLNYRWQSANPRVIDKTEPRPQSSSAAAAKNQE